MCEFRMETAALTTDEIVAAIEGALSHARENLGGIVDARSVDLRLWAAAALINSAITVSTPAAITGSFNEKLAALARPRPRVLG